MTADDLDTKDWFGHRTPSPGADRRARHGRRHCATTKASTSSWAPLAAGDGRPRVRLGTASRSPSTRGWRADRIPSPTATRSARAGHADRAHRLTHRPARHTTPAPSAPAGTSRPSSTTEPWTARRAARAVFARHVDELMAASTVGSGRSAVPTRVVVTHGSPGAMKMVGDADHAHRWDTVGLAAPERDLWLLGLDDPGSVALHRGHRPPAGRHPGPLPRAMAPRRHGHLIQFFRGRHGQGPGRPWPGSVRCPPCSNLDRQHTRSQPLKMGVPKCRARICSSAALGAASRTHGRLDRGAGDEVGPAVSSTGGRIEEEEDTMGKLIVTEFMTLDGVAQAPGGPDEDRDERLRARRMAGATPGPGVRRGHVRASEEHGRPAPRPKDLRDLRRLLAERSGGDPVHRPAQRRPQVRRQPHARRPSRLAGLDARRRATSPRASPPSRSATTRSTSSAVSTSCSRCCASASSTG